MKILIVDEDWRFVQQAREYFESHSHLVVHQNRPHDAVRQANHWRPDLVVLAAQLADERLVNCLHSLPDRPAVLLTEHMDRFDRAWRAWQRCGDELLMKPVFKSQELLDAVVQAMENATVAKDRRGYCVAASA
jgi:DNA-binding response OmpR family regulator